MINYKNSVLLPPIIVFIAVSFVALIAFSSAVRSVEEDGRQVFIDYSSNLNDSIEDRVSVFEESLRSGVGLFDANGTITKEGWKKFIDSVGTAERYPGSQGIGYAKVISPKNKDSFIKASKNDIKPTFEIFPAGDREVYTSIIYLEPQDYRNERAVGYDMFSESTRRSAMEGARDSGEVKISGPVRLVQEDGVDEQFGFLIYAPQYSSKPSNLKERQSNIVGFVYGAFRANSFFDNILINKNNDSVAIRIVSSGVNDSEVIYSSDNYDNIVNNTLHKKQEFSIGGDKGDWVVEYAYIQSMLNTNDSITLKPRNVLLFGIFSAVLIGITTYLLLSRKTQELELLKERDTNDAKDNLLSIASHQLRTPATGVKQYVGMVLEGFMGDISLNQRDMLEKAYESNERQLKTINEVLYLARLESGRIILSKSKVDLVQLLKSIIDEQQNIIEENAQKVVFKKPKTKVYIFADEHMLRMSIENLLSNAIKYTKPKGQINISLKRTKRKLVVSITDTGVGIANSDIDKLFKQFSRIRNDLSKSVSGTGIGLYLAKQLINLHDGDIIVETEQGVGSTFKIEIPH